METNNKAMIAVCDILGFSNLVKEKPLKEIIDYHIHSIYELVQASSLNLVKKTVQPNSSDIPIVGSAVFSDTVLFYSLEDSKLAYEYVIYAVTSLLAQPIQWPEFRFRIGISYGDFYHNQEKNIYVGKALIEAHELEKKQEWCGGALTKAAAEKIESNYYLARYDVPVKQDRVESHLVINWTLAKHEVIDKEYDWLPRSIALPLTEEQGKIESYIRNTERFHLEKCVQCNVVRRHIS